MVTMLTSTTRTMAPPIPNTEPAKALFWRKGTADVVGPRSVDVVLSDDEVRETETWTTDVIVMT